MRKGVKAISVLLLFCVLLGFTGCNDKAKIVGKWKQSNYNSGYSKLKDEFGELEFTKTGKYKRVSSTEHVGFSGTAAAGSGSFKLDEKAGQIREDPDGSHMKNADHEIDKTKCEIQNTTAGYDNGRRKQDSFYPASGCRLFDHRKPADT